MAAILFPAGRVRPRADRYRHQRAELQALGAHAARTQPAPEGAGDHGEHHVVHRAPRAYFTVLNPRALHAPTTAAGAGRSAMLSGTSGAGLSPAQATSLTASADSRSCLERRPGVRERLGARARQRGRAHEALHAFGHQLRGGGLGLGGPVLARGSTGAARVDVEEHAARSTPETPSTSAWWVLEMIAKRCHPRVPVRAISPTAAWFGRGAGRESARQVAQLLQGARGGQCGVAQVVIMLKRGSSIQSGRPTPSAGWRASGESGAPGGGATPGGHELVAGRGRALEDDERPHMHVRGLAFLVEEGRIDGVSQSRCPGSPRPPARPQSRR